MPPPFTPSRPLAYACLALSMALVGSYVALSKPLAAIFPVLLLAWLRFGIGGVAMLHWLKKPPDEPPLPPDEPGAVVGERQEHRRQRRRLGPDLDRGVGLLGQVLHSVVGRDPGFTRGTCRAHSGQAAGS